MNAAIIVFVKLIISSKYTDLNTQAKVSSYTMIITAVTSVHAGLEIQYIEVLSRFTSVPLWLFNSRHECNILKTKTFTDLSRLIVYLDVVLYIPGPGLKF